MTSKKRRGAPPKAKVGDAKSIIEKVKMEFDKFDAQVANSLPELLAAYYDLGVNPKNGETTRRTVLKELIERAEGKLEEEEKEVKGEAEETEEIETSEVSLISVNFRG
ncbi:hypothetical protein VPH5P1C_0267 [Vibrio phage 5P1c]